MGAVIRVTAVAPVQCWASYLYSQKMNLGSELRAGVVGAGAVYRWFFEGCSDMWAHQEQYGAGHGEPPGSRSDLVVSYGTR